MLFVLLVATLGFDAGGPLGQRMREEGRLQLNRLTEMSRLPSSGACWKSAVQRLHGSCDGLSSDAQAGVALGLTDCFLQASGRRPTGCGDAEDRRGCMASMAPEAFHAYTVFYTHAQNICFFLRGELWHEETERTIQKLAAASAQVSSHMEAVSNFLDVSHEGLMSAITDLRSWSLGEMLWFHGLAFYVAGLAVVFALGSASRTNGARPWLCLVLTLNLVLEYSVLAWLASRLGGTLEEQSLRGKSWAVWSRKVAAAVCFALVLAKVLLYRDYASENNRLLRELKTDTKQLLGELRQGDKVYGSGVKSRSSTVPAGERRTDRVYDASEKSRYSTDKVYDASEKSRYGTDKVYDSEEKSRYGDALGGRRTDRIYEATGRPRTDTPEPQGFFRARVNRIDPVYVEKPEVYDLALQERLKSRPQMRGYSPYRKFDYGLQRSSTPLSDVVVPLSKRDFYTPERERSADPRLNATPVVVLTPLDLGDRSRRGSSVSSNVSTHSYILRSVRRP